MLHVPTPAARAAVAAAALLLAPAAGGAGGFALFDQGARGMGFAGAYTAQASDPSAIFHNAAGIAFLKGRQLYAGGAVLPPRTTFTGADPVPGAGIVERTDNRMMLPPALYYTHQFSERLVLGAGLYKPFGLSTAWSNPDTFSGRFLAQKVEIESYSFNPTAAYRVADRLAVGIGLDARVSSMALQRRIPGEHPVTRALVDVASLRIDGNTDTAFGFNVGVLARPTENLSVGAQYRHSVSQGYRGTAEFSLIPTGVPALDAAVIAVIPVGTVPVRTAINFPAVITTGAAYTWGDWTFAGDVDLYQWSRFQQLAFDYEGHPELREVVAQDYADSLQIRAGVERRLGTAWAARAGYVFEDSPAPSVSLSPLLHDADRHGVAVGGSWRYGSWRIDGAGGFILSQRRSTGASSMGYDGTYESRAVTFGLSVGYVF